MSLKDVKAAKIEFQEKLKTTLQSLTSNTIETVAHIAQQETLELLHTNTGVHQAHQFSRANIVRLTTTFDEIIQLRQIDPKFRQGYKEDEESPTIPVISAIISWTETNDLNCYYYEVSQLFLHKNTLILGDGDFDKRIDTDNTTSNYIVNNKLNKQKILNEN